CAITLLCTIFLYFPLMQGGMELLLVVSPSLGSVVDPAAASETLSLWGLLLGALVVSLLFFLGLVLIGPLLVFTVPRVLNLLLELGRAYPLYGFHDRVHRVITRLTTFRFFLQLFGDSSYIVHYLRYLGYHLLPVEQTGSNFGTALKQANPFLCAVGTGTMVA